MTNEMDALRNRARQQVESSLARNRERDLANLDLAQRAARDDLKIWSRAIDGAMKAERQSINAWKSGSGVTIHYSEPGLLWGVRDVEAYLPGLTPVFGEFHLRQGYVEELKRLLGMPFAAFTTTIGGETGDLIAYSSVGERIYSPDTSGFDAITVSWGAAPSSPPGTPQKRHDPDPRPISTANDPVAVQLGVSKFWVDDFEGAIADLTRAISTFPTYARAYKIRGDAYLKLGKRAEADKDFKKARELDPTLSR